MKTNPLKEGALTINASGIGTVTGAMVTERAVEIAVISGHSQEEVTENDWAQAKRELTGEPEMDPNDSVLEAAPESDRWNPLPGTTGGKTAAAFGDDEDEDGRSDSARLVEEGMKEAEHDQMLQAARERALADGLADAGEAE
jgi:hypothetical protein